MMIEFDCIMEKEYLGLNLYELYAKKEVIKNLKNTFYIFIIAFLVVGSLIQNFISSYIESYIQGIIVLSLLTLVLKLGSIIDRKLKCIDNCIKEKQK